MANERVIVLRGTPTIDEQNLCGATGITPGMLIDIDTSVWVPHPDSAVGAVVFALERDELGDGIDVAYVEDDRVKAAYMHLGERVNALVASGQTIVEGAQMEAAAGGLLVAGTTATQIVGVAAEAIDTTSGQGRGAVIIEPGM